MVSTSKTIENVTEVFDALEKFINQRPGLNARDYGFDTNGLRAYRQELRSIAADKKRALAALDEARALSPKPELLADAFRAFSGRLQWVPQVALKPCMIHRFGHFPNCPTCASSWSQSHLEYTTGQYWPTEYRKAAASVLEAYISAWKQAENSATPRTFTYASIADVRAANHLIGNHWFDRGSMRFFNTKIESGLLKGKYFITSERYDETRAKAFTVRRAEPDGSIDTVGEFQQYRTLEDARDAVKGL